MAEDKRPSAIRASPNQSLANAPGLHLSQPEQVFGRPQPVMLPFSSLIGSPLFGILPEPSQAIIPSVHRKTLIYIYYTYIMISTLDSSDFSSLSFFAMLEKL
jgi:hypothetical protein